MHFNVYFLLYYNVFLHSVITPEVKQKWSLHRSYFITIVDVMVEICSCCSYFFFFFAFSIFSIPHVAGLLEENTQIVLMNKIIV